VIRLQVVEFELLGTCKKSVFLSRASLISTCIKSPHFALLNLSHLIHV